MTGDGCDEDSSREHGGVSASESLTQARLELALEAAQLGLWDWDLTTDALVWDERSVVMYGLTGVALSGLVGDIEQPIHPEDLPRVQAALAGAIETAGTVDVEFRVRWPDGSLRWLYARGQALVDASGQVVRVIGTNLDVTERRNSAELRAADAERMAGLVSVAQALGDAHTELEVLEVVTGRGLRLLGALGMGLCLAEPHSKRVRILITNHFEADLRADVAELPADLPLPTVRAAVDGTAYFFADRAAAVALFPSARSCTCGRVRKHRRQFRSARTGRCSDRCRWPSTFGTTGATLIGSCWRLSLR